MKTLKFYRIWLEPKRELSEEEELSFNSNNYTLHKVKRQIPLTSLASIEQVEGRYEVGFKEMGIESLCCIEEFGQKDPYFINIGFEELCKIQTSFLENEH
jgi:hypothetical protein